MSPSTVQMQNLNGSPYTVSSAPEFRQEESTAVEEKLMSPNIIYLSILINQIGNRAAKQSIADNFKIDHVVVRIRPLSTNETGRSLYVVDSKPFGNAILNRREVEQRLLPEPMHLFYIIFQLWNYGVNKNMMDVVDLSKPNSIISYTIQVTSVLIIKTSNLRVEKILIRTSIACRLVETVWRSITVWVSSVGRYIRRSVRSDCVWGCYVWGGVRCCIRCHIRSGVRGGVSGGVRGGVWSCVWCCVCRSVRGGDEWSVQTTLASVSDGLAVYGLGGC
ncbi:hypothetical protein AGLY_011235 [Aphis glycines]|uniref:Uncharacterized protein n=1 Tax=Aphis glycines TaxID=307491 RepID=A0A6G0TCV2_APHGL|nr:hypothetical protein AGLY_011235 [Aphis glycines]